MCLAEPSNLEVIVAFIEANLQERVKAEAPPVNMESGEGDEANNVRHPTGK